jgi:hypothetical protein
MIPGVLHPDLHPTVAPGSFAPGLSGHLAGKETGAQYFGVVEPGWEIQLYLGATNT